MGVRRALRRHAILAFVVLLLTGCDSILREQIELFVGIRNDGVIYVDGAGGDDANPGTKEQPKRTIQNAINLADALMESGEVWVAEGTYTSTRTLSIKEGISILGGFAVPDWDRDIALNTTILEGQDIEIVIKPVSGVTGRTLIEGFTIRADVVAYAVCIWCETCSPTIRRNILDASQGSTNTIGILNSSSSPVIYANTINAGSGSAAAWGIANNGSPAIIRSNVIYGTGSDEKYVGIYNNNSDAVIQNNTIRCGLGSGAVGIHNDASNCTIENNILFSAGTSRGINEASTAAFPTQVNNNVFFNCSPIYDYDTGSCTTLTDLVTYLTSNSVPVAGNLADDPQFVGSMDWHLQSSSTIKDKGLDLSSYFTKDRDWISRNDPWSIGAYERNL
jgi:hypothetical protein